MHTNFHPVLNLLNRVALVEGGHYPDIIAIAEVVAELERTVRTIEDSHASILSRAQALSLTKRKLHRLHLLSHEFTTPKGGSAYYAQAMAEVQKLTTDLELKLEQLSTEEQ